MSVCSDLGVEEVLQVGVVVTLDERPIPMQGVFCAIEVVLVGMIEDIDGGHV